MSVKILNNRKVNLGCLFILAAIILAVYISISFAGNGSTKTMEDPNIAAEVMAKRMAAMERQLITSVTKGIKPSLETKENMDFLLTPALLMQEAMSHEIVITYPTE